VSKTGKNGIARWRLARIRAEDVPPLPTTTAAHGTQLFVWQGGPLEMGYECADHNTGLQFRHHAFDSGELLDLSPTHGVGRVTQVLGQGKRRKEPRTTQYASTNSPRTAMIS
jgi:hypothetical protein